MSYETRSRYDTPRATMSFNEIFDLTARLGVNFDPYNKNVSKNFSLHLDGNFKVSFFIINRKKRFSLRISTYSSGPDIAAP